MRGPVSRCGGALWGLRAMVIVLQMVVSEAKIVAWAATFNHIRRGLGGQGRLAGKYRGVLRAWAGGLLIRRLFWHNSGNQNVMVTGELR